MPDPSPARLRRKRIRQVTTALLAALLVALSIVLYLDERDSRQASVAIGTASGPDWVEFDTTIQKADPTSGQVTLSVIPVPHGSLAQGRDSLVFARSVTVTVTSLAKSSFRVTAGAAPAQQQIPIGVLDGTITDYPFDRYQIEVGFSATAQGGGPAPVPVTMTIRDTDPFFVLHPLRNGQSAGGVVLDADLGRSRSTFILAWFMMAAMWALALAVAGGARVLVRKRPGIVWPALGWMAATLFALVSLRNAAPGAPPIGSIMDYLAFFWAEGVIAVSLTVTAVTGIRAESRPPAPTAG